MSAITKIVCTYSDFTGNALFSTGLYSKVGSKRHGAGIWYSNSGDLIKAQGG
jgi:hypothetical protein